ncbi:unnamed protein product [Acanthoscelides obtectus]|uniref:Uncharacterized protein n=1 Tax=Acanthoscelides obtectus TaxID=200917 RepID=A0A9P0M8B7_ACAOB|nr:unnamed protein product [Acanthoscelides obtectus]CAK1682327.1 hypothetical protein AOBTE_LOCUS33571 [Acanthoscelides obtectus]
MQNRLGQVNKIFLIFQTLDGIQNMCVRANTCFNFVKCRNTECCRPKSSLFRLLDRFLPPPVKVKKQLMTWFWMKEGNFLIFQSN